MTGKSYEETGMQAPPEMAAGVLFDNGYRQISRKHRTVARVDVPDLDAALIRALDLTPLEIKRWSSVDKRDYWSRVWSGDAIYDVPEEIMMFIRELTDSEIVSDDPILVMECKDNTGMSDSFDVGVNYVLGPLGKDYFLRVYDKFGVLKECYRDRFGIVAVES